MDVRLRVVDSSIGFKTFFDSVSFRLLRDAAKVIQENHYYPFGQNMVGIEELDQQSLSSQEEQKFQYNAKEKLDEFGLYWNDHGARNLDLQTLGWTSVDSLAEKFAPMSPYVAMGNNPVMFLDLDGREVKPTSPQAFELIKKGLRPKDAAKLKLNDDGNIVLGGGKGSNYRALKKLVNASVTTEIRLATNFTSKNSDGTISEKDMNKSLTETVQRKTEEGGEVSEELYQAMLADAKAGDERGDNIHLLGLTVVPEGESYDKNGGSPNKNIVVTVDPRDPTGEKELTKTVAHELRHSLRFIQAGHQKWHHGDKKLEKQIKKAEKEASKNYENHKN